ncbi:MAG: hypothetical protein N2690_00375 [Rhodocyclaceae bacterium]|nr:hypothetical protein [Rhodocyclaceae bacterium]
MTKHSRPAGKRAWPDIETDLRIIANVRASLIEPLVSPPPGRFPVQAFDCGPRLYLSDQRGLVAVFPYDVHDELDDLLLALLPHSQPPIEYWFLENDQVILFGETDDEDIERARRWHAIDR